MSRPRIRYQLAVSLDGLIAPPDGSSAWLDPYGDMAMELMGPFMEQIGGLLMGRVCCEMLRDFGPGPFDDIPTVVLTSNPDFEVAPSAEVCCDGPQAAIDALGGRVDRGDFWLFGGGLTATSFLDAGLVDLIELTVVPIVLGEGQPLFSGARAVTSFDLVSSRAGELGTVSTVYARRSD